MQFKTEKQLIEFFQNNPEWTQEAVAEVFIDFRSGKWRLYKARLGKDWSIRREQKEQV